MITSFRDKNDPFRWVARIVQEPTTIDQNRVFIFRRALNNTDLEFLVGFTYDGEPIMQTVAEGAVIKFGDVEFKGFRLQGEVLLALSELIRGPSEEELREVRHQLTVERARVDSVINAATGFIRYADREMRKGV